MNIGDLVKVKNTSHAVFAVSPKAVGIIIDSLEMSDGFTEYEVMFEDWGIGWFSDLMLEGTIEQE